MEGPSCLVVRAFLTDRVDVAESRTVAIELLTRVKALGAHELCQL